jgi:hypothetical protein
LLFARRGKLSEVYARVIVDMNGRPWMSAEDAIMQVRLRRTEKHCDHGPSPRYERDG